ALDGVGAETALDRLQARLERNPPPDVGAGPHLLRADLAAERTDQRAVLDDVREEPGALSVARDPADHAAVVEVREQRPPRVRATGCDLLEDEVGEPAAPSRSRSQSAELLRHGELEEAAVAQLLHVRGGVVAALVDAPRILLELGGELAGASHPLGLLR